MNYQNKTFTVGATSKDAQKNYESNWERIFKGQTQLHEGEQIGEYVEGTLRSIGINQVQAQKKGE